MLCYQNIFQDCLSLPNLCTQAQLAKIKLYLLYSTFYKFENYILKIILIITIEISKLKKQVLYFQKIVSNIRVSTVL